MKRNPYLKNINQQINKLTDNNFLLNYKKKNIKSKKISKKSKRFHNR
ncbi:hypothetical protein LSO9J_30068 [Candidatus Liberibacter solanacearum]